MSLRKRRIGRRALGVVVGASLVVLGLQLPALAAPAITGFTPTSGPDDCVIVVTGSGFLNPDIEDGDVEIGGNAADFEVQSDTEIWVAANGTTGLITITNSLGQGPATSATAFVDTAADPGTCGPTIAALSPDCGTVGTPVEVQGTNLISFAGVSDGTNVAGDFESGAVEFSPFVGGTGQAATPTGVPDTPTALHVSAPVDADTGPVLAATAVDDVLSDVPFTVVADAAECPSGAPKHPRSISLTLRKHLVAKGKVTSTEDPAVTECFAGVPVKIQRRKAGSWKTVGSTTTNDLGKYKRRIKDKPGKYRALAPAVTLADDTVCAKARSPRVRHRH